MGGTGSLRLGVGSYFPTLTAGMSLQSRSVRGRAASRPQSCIAWDASGKLVSGTLACIFQKLPDDLRGQGREQGRKRKSVVPGRRQDDDPLQGPLRPAGCRPGTRLTLAACAHSTASTAPSTAWAQVRTLGSKGCPGAEAARVFLTCRQHWHREGLGHGRGRPPLLTRHPEHRLKAGARNSLVST